MIVFLHHSVNPYRVAFFTALHKIKVPFIVYFLSAPAANRRWKKNDFSLPFPHRFLSGWKITLPGNDHSYFQINTDVLNYLAIDKPTMLISIGWNYLATFLAAGYAVAKHIRLVIWSESTHFESSWQRTVTRPIIWLLLKFSWRCIVAGNRSRKYLEDFGVSPEKIRLAYYTVDTAQLIRQADKLHAQRPKLRKAAGYAEHQVAVLSVGQFISRKGIHAILEAAKRLHDNKTVVFTFVGYGDLQPIIESAAQTNPCIKVVTYVKPEKIMEQFVAADIFVLASLEETWGLVVNEAQCAGLPVLVSNLAGSSDDLVIEGENGYTFDPHSPESLARLLVKLSSSQTVRRKLGQAGREHIRQFSITQNCRIITELLNESQTD